MTSICTSIPEWPRKHLMDARSSNHEVLPGCQDIVKQHHLLSQRRRSDLGNRQ
jgi:hypothetical protein